MKRKAVVLLLCLFLFAGCSAWPGEQPSPADGAEAAPSAPGEDVSDTAVLAYGDNFRVVKKENFAYCCEIYDATGNLVAQEETGTRCPSIEVRDGNVLDISIGMGTGLISHKFYSLDRNCFSGEYWNVVAYSNEKVAYIRVPEQNSLENRTLMIQNVFDSASDAQEIRLDFSAVDSPVLEAAFTSDTAQLKMTFLQGEDAKEETKVIDIAG